MDFMAILTKIVAFLCSFLIPLSNGLNTLFNGDIYPFESNTKVIGLETFDRSQGVTTDGEYWFFSGKGSLTKVNIETNEVEVKNGNPFLGFEDYGVDHVGGISYYNGYIYAGLEDSKVWNSPLVVLYDAETLEYAGKFVHFNTELLNRGCPWVCCDAQRGYFYVANSRNTTEMYCFDLDTLEYVKTAAFETEVKAIQGAEMYDGIMYAATNDATRAVYQINPDTGSVTKYFDRIMYQPLLIDNFGGEGEDITVLHMEDGTLFHALDLGTLFIDANLRHYKPIA